MSAKPTPISSQPLTYSDAGVDIDAGNHLVELIKPLARSTKRIGADSELGGFGGLFDLKQAGFKDPILVAANDGVGTKLKIALAMGVHDTIGIDLVAMCVNDLVVQGAEPLLFLDYYASAHLDVKVAVQVVKGIAAGCIEAGCALIGGETAEMPGLYQKGDYDLAGFAVGAVERGGLLPRSDIKQGDVLLGLASHGLHSNGFSMVRKVIESVGLSYHQTAPFASDQSLGMALLTPTRLYVKSCLAAIKSGKIKALAHITGGGLVENIPRVLPKGRRAVIDEKNWRQPEIFTWLAQIGQIKPEEMMRVFNCGIGMVAVVAVSDVVEVRRLFEKQGETVFTIGHIE